MSELQLIASLGIGGGLAVLFALWIMKWLIPQLFIRFDTALKAFREEMALERENHIQQTKVIADEIAELRKAKRLL